MRHENLYLNDIVEAADDIARFISGLAPEDFQNSDLVRSAVVQKLPVIGEAVARLSNEIKERNPQVEWAQITGFRNVLIHAYFGIDWDIVWQAAKDKCPILRELVAEILAAESGHQAE